MKDLKSINNGNNKKSELFRESDESRHSKLTYMSFSTYNFAGSFVVSAQFLFLFFFYEAVIGLNALYIAGALTIAALWDAFNDPLVGYLTDRNTRLTKRLGRRFPWILLGIIPWCFSLLLIYLPPEVDPANNAWFLFSWLALSLCVFDTFHSLIYVNIVHLRADKFRTESERRTLASIYTPIDIFGRVFGMLLPPILISFGTGREGYVFMAIVISLIVFIASLIFLPGTREDQVMIKRYYANEQENKIGFLEGMKESIKLRSFIVFIIAFTAFQIVAEMLTSNAIYVVTFVLRVDPATTTLMFALFLLGAIVSVPFWVWLAKKLDNNKKTMTIGGFSLCIALIPMTFFQTILDFFIFVFILGFSLGCWWALFLPVIQPNVMDEFVVRIKKDQKGVLIGLVTFIIRLTSTISVIIFALVHTLTGFVPGYHTYEGLEGAVDNIELVLLGIRLLMGIIPMVIILIGTLIFWRFYPLTQDVVLENKAKLKELGF
ncbi:MAG: MFS transporter [Candidatus Lokiarchaeota archaeon]|nr:MFS transporter [Candidatus Lokiarchaeota archaeon]MBD3342462.1 MFS transporter [Candidatus Lokiarchaeota archaeon]